MEEDPSIADSELHAFADGRLPEDRRAAVEAWLAARPGEAEKLAAYQRITAEVRSFYEPVLAEPMPERLERAAMRRRNWSRMARAAAWMALGVAIGTMAGWQLHASRPV